MSRKFDPEMYDRYIEASLKYSLVPPVISPEVPLRYYPEVDDYTMSSGMARTPKGRIWIAWFGNEDGDGAVMLLAHSDDDGKTFSKPDFIVDPGFIPGGVHISAVVGNLWTAPDGRLFFFVMQSLGFYDGRGGVWQSICENPDDGKPNWSVPVRLWHGAALNKPTVLENGTWLLPVALWHRGLMTVEQDHHAFQGRSKLFRDLDRFRGSNILASSDQGKSWQLRGHVSNLFDMSFDEPMLIERKDRSLLMYMRDCHGMTQSESSDEGNTWSAPVKTPFFTAAARFFLTRLASGNALLVRYSNPVETEQRSHLTAYVSKDEGVTWQGGLLLDERYDVSYPDGFQAPDGRIYVQYDRKRESGEILLAVFTEQDVLAGGNVSGKVLLKHPAVQSYSARLGSLNAQ
ncbi:MAG: sialidase family protein [Victivallales bacterium]